MAVSTLAAPLVGTTTPSVVVLGVVCDTACSSRRPAVACDALLAAAAASVCTADGDCYLARAGKVARGRSTTCSDNQWELNRPQATGRVHIRPECCTLDALHLYTGSCILLSTLSTQCRDSDAMHRH